MEVWYNRDEPRTYKYVPELEPYTTGQQWISLTQAACVTSLKNGPKTFLKMNQALAHELDINLTHEKHSGVRVFTDNGEEDDFQEEVHPQDEIVNLILDTQLTKTPSQDDLEGFEPVKKGIKGPLRLDYSDPWKILAGRELSSVRGKTPSELTVWYADLHRISDPIPIELLGPSFSKGLKKEKRCRPIPIQKIKCIDCVIHLIRYHTHWGSSVWKYSADPDKSISRWASTLKDRLVAFLKGKPDPLWQKDEVERYYTNPEELRDYSSRALRLIEVLKTLSGIFVQRYLTIPEEIWTWKKFDLFNLEHLSFLITDEFFDGECTESILDVKTFYKSLKDSRKLFKMVAFNELPFETIVGQIPDWMRLHIPVWKRILNRPFSEHKAYQIGIYCQSRGCGTPPMIDVLLSKRKFVQTVTIEAPPLEQGKKALIRSGILEILRTVPDHAFTGLTNKAVITVTTSACSELGVRDGGTTQAIANELSSLGPSAKIPIRDLDTGKISEWVPQDSLEIGEKIFWHCLQKILETDPKELRKVSLLVVKEPGKARCVTKGLSYLKVVLDVVNKICSHPLKKGIASSQSGMSKESHGWEFFKGFFDAGKEPEMFHIKNVEQIVLGTDRTMRTETYEDVFVSSTDYETATDFMNYEVASMISGAWMQKCGIPKVLRGIVLETCYKPRIISFHATGPLRRLGDPTNTEGIRSITTCRGVLMGDPLTKPCLHILNVLARVIASRISDRDFLSY